MELLVGNERLQKLTVTTCSLVHDMKYCLLGPDRSAHCYYCVRYAAEFLCQGCLCDNLGWWSGAGGCTVLDEFHVVGWEHSKMAVRAEAPPPALVDHLDPCDDFIGIERDLSVIS